MELFESQSVTSQAAPVTSSTFQKVQIILAITSNSIQALVFLVAISALIWHKDRPRNRSYCR